MFGTGKASIIIKQALNEQTNILAYIDNDRSKWSKIIDNVKILGPQYIKNFNYDYIIIASQYNEEIYSQLISIGIERHKIFQYSKFVSNYYNYYKYFINLFIENTFEVDALITGISYANTGFDERVCCRKAFKFTFWSQDIFYDYHTVKYLITNYKNRVNSIKYVIIGLCYYSFQYDMSLSAMKDKVLLYYDVLKQSHNFKGACDNYEEYEISGDIASKIFKRNSNGNYDFQWKVPNLKDCKDKWILGESICNMDCNKNYPETVKENTKILKSYLELLKEYNIKPIAVVFPASKYYTKYFSKRIEDEFHSIINEVRKKHDFQYIDYFRSDLFTDDDFQDVSHLNPQGAEKFTKMLNEIIEW